jgi:hypothetical protein
MLILVFFIEENYIWWQNCLPSKYNFFLSHDQKFRKYLYLSATYLLGYWKGSENGRVVTIGIELTTSVVIGGNVNILLPYHTTTTTALLGYMSIM